MDLYYRVGWHLVRDKEDVKVNLFTGQQLSSMNIRQLDQLRETVRSDPESDWEVGLADPDQWPLGLVFVSHRLHE